MNHDMATTCDGVTLPATHTVNTLTGPAHLPVAVARFLAAPDIDDSGTRLYKIVFLWS